jgi:hypothetical protein
LIKRRINPATHGSFYDARKALMIFNREALTAGRKPPTNPMKREKIKV